MKMKRCKVCGEVKPLNEFQKNGKKPDGTGYYYKPQCVLCYNEMHRKRYREDPEYRKDKQERLNKWRNNNREHVREHLNKYRRDRYNNDEEYKNKVLESNREFRKTEAGRIANVVGTQRYIAKKSRLPNDLTVAEYQECLEYFGGACCYCGTVTNLVQEHVVPVSKGGGTTKSNIVCACPSCNSSKGNKDMVEWYSRQPFYSADRLTRIYNWIKGGGANAKQD